jgi:hypothetical protein
VKSRTLAPHEWIPRRERHRHKVSALLDAYLRQRARGRANPVVDFLFTYYNLTPGQLRRWHPGFGVTLAGPEAGEYAALRGYCRTDAGVRVTDAHLARRRETVVYVTQLMEATARRPASLGCFGLHEWAMVYRSGAGGLRHDVPLRLGHDGTDSVVESMPLRCTHFDAFRFFTDQARPKNAAQLTRSGQVSAEQPGCLHAGMDLYKFTAKLLPLVSSDLTLEAFELAYAARELDMRASPYDLGAYGYESVPIETPAGRAEYVRQQAALSQRAAAIRAALIADCRKLLGASAADVGVYAHAEDDGDHRANTK